MPEAKRMWEIKQSTTPGTLELYIYGDVESDYRNRWSGEVTRSETSANAFRDALTSHPNITQINVYINSYGGSVFEGTAIYNQLKRHAANKTVYIDGFACSVASVIAMAGDKVVMPRNAMMMVHHASMGAYGNPAELRKVADDLEQINKGNRQAYLQKAGEKLAEEKLIELLDDESWLTAEDCINLGFADEYAEKDADMTNAAKILQKSNIDLQQRITVQKSLAAQLKQLFEDSESDRKKKLPPTTPTSNRQENKLTQFICALAQHKEEK